MKTKTLFGVMIGLLFLLGIKSAVASTEFSLGTVRSVPGSGSVLLIAGGNAMTSDSDAREQDDPEVFQIRAHQFFAKGDLTRAIRVLRKAIEAHTENPQLHFMLANALFRQREWLGAIDHYNKAAQLRLSHPDTYLGLGFAYYQMRQVNKAVSAWNMAVGQSDNNMLAHLSLALGLSTQGRIVDARKHLSRAININPNWRKHILIDIRWEQNMVQEVDDLLEKLN